MLKNVNLLVKIILVKSLIKFDYFPISDGVRNTKYFPISVNSGFDVRFIVFENTKPLIIVH